MSGNGRQGTCITFPQVPGAAAVAYSKAKARKYEHVANVVPFIVEMGGRLGAEACAFIDSLVDPLKSSDLEVRRSIYRKLCRELARQQCYMLTNLASELQRPDAAASGSG